MEECCGGGMGCGCNTASFYSDKACPDCGHRLRVTGDIRQVKVRLACSGCGYHSSELSVEELREVIG